MKRLFPYLNILLITAISFLSVKMLYGLVETQLEGSEMPRPMPVRNRLKPAKFKSPPLSHYRTIVDRDIFQTSKNSVAAAEKIVVENIKPTERNLKLWGTVVGTDAESSYAIIEESAARGRRSRQALYHPGDTVQGAVIEKILREKIILSADGKNEILNLVERKSVGSVRRSPGQYNQGSNRIIRQKRVLRRSQIQNAINSTENLLSQADIRPHSEGIQISRIKRRSIFRRMGLRNGDIITEVGDRPVRSVDDASDVWQSLQSDGNTSVKIIRRGRTRVIDYHIR